MELHGSFEDGIRASKQVQENHYLRYAVYFLLCSRMCAELLALGSLEFGMIILVFILMTFSPVVIEVITEWCRSLYNKAHEKEKKGIISLFWRKCRNND